MSPETVAFEIAIFFLSTNLAPVPSAKTSDRPTPLDTCLGHCLSPCPPPPYRHAHASHPHIRHRPGRRDLRLSQDTLLLPFAARPFSPRVASIRSKPRPSTNQKPPVPIISVCRSTPTSTSLPPALLNTSVAIGALRLPMCAPPPPLRLASFPSTRTPNLNSSGASPRTAGGLFHWASSSLALHHPPFPLPTVLYMAA